MDKRKLYESVMKNVSKEVKKALLEYNGSDAINDAEKSGFDRDSIQYKSILGNGRASVFYGMDPEDEYIPSAAEIASTPAELNFRNCFMVYDPNTKSVSVYGYDDLEDLCYLYGIDLDDKFYHKLNMIRVGESIINSETNAIYTKIKSSL